MKKFNKLFIIGIFLSVFATLFSVGLKNYESALAFDYPDPFYYGNEKYLYSHVGFDSRVWNVTRGETDNHKSRVVVIDSGVEYNNKEFLDKNGNTRISPLSYNVDTGAIAGIDGYDDISDSGKDKHGTSVVSVIFANGNNGYGISGLAQDVELIMVKMTLSARGTYTTKQLGDALDYVLSLDGVDVVNMSLGYYDGENQFQTQLKAIRDKGTMIVSSAGNEKRSDTNFPAADESVIGVGAFEDLTNKHVGSDYALADYSSYGDLNVDICAPGEMYTLDTDTFLGGSSSEGTSFAAPVVTSAIALFKSLHPDFSPEETERALFASAVDKADYGKDYLCGYGAVNFYNLICGDFGECEFVHADGSIDTETVCEIDGEAIPLQKYPFLSEYSTFFGGWYSDLACLSPISQYREKIGIGQRVYEKTTETMTDYAFDYTFDRKGNLLIKGYYGSSVEIWLDSLDVSGGVQSVYKISPRAFEGLKEAKIVTVNVEIIDEFAFVGCEFNYLYISKTVKSVAKSAVFSSKGNILAEEDFNAFTENWDLQSELKTFENCGEYTVFDDLEAVGTEEDGYTLLGGKDVSLLKSDKKIIGVIDGAFKNSESLESIDLPQAEYVGAEAFFGCKNLKSIKFGSLNSIGDRAFSGCESLFVIDLREEENLISIGEYAFENCGLEIIALPLSLEKIGLGAFALNNPSVICVPFLGNRKNAVSYSFLGYFFGASRYATQKSVLPTNLKELLVFASIADNALYGLNSGVKVYAETEYSGYSVITDFEVAEIYYNGELCGLTGIMAGASLTDEEVIKAAYTLKNVTAAEIEKDGNVYTIIGKAEHQETETSEESIEDETPPEISEKPKTESSCKGSMAFPVYLLPICFISYLILKKKR